MKADVIDLFLGTQALSAAVKNYEDNKSGEALSTTGTANKEATGIDKECCECRASNPIEAEFCMSCGEGLG